MGVVGDGSSRLFFFFPDGPQIIKMDHVSSPVQPLGLPYFWRKGCQSLVSGTPAASCLPPTLTQAPPQAGGTCRRCCLGPSRLKMPGTCRPGPGQTEWALGAPAPSGASAHGPFGPQVV